MKLIKFVSFNKYRLNLQAYVVGTKCNKIAWFIFLVASRKSQWIIVVNLISVCTLIKNV